MSKEPGSVQSVPRVGWPAFKAILVDRGSITPQDLALAEQHAHREQMELVDAVVALGLVSERDSYSTLAQAAGVETVDLTAVESSELAIRLVPERLARRHSAVPLSVDNRVLTFATCRPFSPDLEQDMGFASGRRTRMVVAQRTDVVAALGRCYPKMREVDVLAERLRPERPAPRPETTPVPTIDKTSSVIELCDNLIARAVDMGASDIHIECGSDGTAVRYRICGVLEPVLMLPASVSQPVRNRFKVMARADITARRKPQDGAFRRTVRGRPIDVRLSTLPTVEGEKMVMRVIDTQSPLQALDALGYDASTLARLRQVLTKKDGLVLVTGPTGTGKTTVLYAALAHLQTGHSTIVTVEDPVERSIPGITQIPVNAKAGNTYQAVLRSLLRQDPNVIMVGEIRDAEMAQMVGHAAFTGHLVLSSMHTADAASAITRLTNLGLEPHKFAESLTAVLSQRLVRVLCAQCQRRHTEFEARRRGLEHGLTEIAASAGAGCEACSFTGYAGRVPVAELLTPTDDLRDAIVRGATAHEIRTAMQAAGVPTMREQAMRLVAAGRTSIEEVTRVLADDVPPAAAAAARQSPRVLVTDDEPITRMLVKLLLEKQQYHVYEAANGRDAIEIATREHPDLILIDLNMPEMNGYEAIARMRRDLSLALVPIVVLTAEEGREVERRVLELGADDYLVKPFAPDVLLSRVDAVFRRRKVVAA